MRITLLVFVAIMLGHMACAQSTPVGKAFFDEHCTDCHDSATKKAGLDLAELEWDLKFGSSTASSVPGLA